MRHRATNNCVQYNDGGIDSRIIDLAKNIGLQLMAPLTSLREHLLLPWTVQEREDPVLEFDRAEGVWPTSLESKLDVRHLLFHLHGNQEFSDDPANRL
jgi:hypothetical protein